MTLDINQTTQLTEAVENSVQAVCDTLNDLGQRTEQLVSDVTRNDGAQATSADLAVDASSLYVAWMKGAARITTNFVDNLVLVTTPVTEYWTSDMESFSTPLPAGNWGLVAAATEPTGKVVPATAMTLLDDQDRPVGPGAKGAVSLDATWNGQFRVRLWRYADPIDELNLSVQAVPTDGTVGPGIVITPFAESVLLSADLDP